MRRPAQWVARVSRELGFLDPPAELMVSDGERTLLFDGVLFDRTQLTKAAAAPERASDAELALAAYRQFGAAAPELLNGAFAMVAWNARDQTILAARDRVGSESLFRLEAGNDVLFSNSVDVLRGAAPAACSPSRVALASFIARRLPYQDETFYSGVRRIPQAHLWTLERSGRSTLRRYWDPRLGAGADERVTPEDFDALLAQALHDRVARDPVAVYVSSGIDSLAIAAYALDACRSKGGATPLALSLVVPGEELKPGEAQRHAAAALGIEQVILPLRDPDEDGILSAALRLAARWPVPHLGPWLPGFLRLNRAAADRGCRTILTGVFGDEWQTLPFVAADLMRQVDVRRLAAFVAREHRAWGESWPKTAQILLWTFGLRALLAAELQQPLERWARPLVRARLERVLPTWLGPDAGLRAEVVDRPTLLPSPVHRSVSLRATGKTYDHPLQDLDMEESTEAARRFGLRMAHPFCERALLELRYRAREDDLERDGEPKYVIRSALERRHERLAAVRGEEHTSPFFAEVLFAEHELISRQIGSPVALGEAGIVDPQGFDRHFAEVVAARDVSGADRIWDVLVMESWLRNHG